MIDVSRRLFLGGAISLIAATTFKATNASNMPTIYGDGKQDDSAGIGALFRNEPVIFSKDMIGVSDHKGIVFHHGRFVIESTVNIPENTKISFETNAPLDFIGNKLPDGWPFFMCEDFSGHQFDSKATFICPPNDKPRKLVDYNRKLFDDQHDYDKMDGYLNMINSDGKLTARKLTVSN